MADEDVRALERAWRESGSVEDETKWLLARLRAGEVAHEALAMLAFLGHAASRAAIGEAPPAWEQEDANLWVVRLKARGKEWLVRATLALARSAMPHWREAFPEDARPVSALAAAEAWALCPCDSHRDAAKAAEDAAGDAAREAVPDQAEEGWGDEDEEEEGRITELKPRLSPVELDRREKAALAADLARDAAHEAASPMAQGAGTSLYSAIRSLAPGTSRYARNAGCLPYPEMRRLMVAELAPWVLKTREPLHEAASEAGTPGISTAEREALKTLAPALRRAPAAVVAALRELAGGEVCVALSRALQGE